MRNLSIEKLKKVKKIPRRRWMRGGYEKIGIQTWLNQAEI